MLISQLVDAIDSASNRMDCPISEEDMHTMGESATVVGWPGHKRDDVAGYFSTEGTILVAYYFDAPRIFRKWFDMLNDELKPLGLHMEEKNCSEFEIYED